MTFSRRPLFAALLALAFLMARPSAAADVKFGAGVTLKQATPAADLYATPEKFVGKKIRVDGIVTSVCTEMGCWMALAPAGAPDRAVRFKADDGGPIVFPISAKGKHASAEGVFMKVAANDHEAADAATEQAAASHPASAKFLRQYQIKVTGAVVQ